MFLWFAGGAPIVSVHPHAYHVPPVSCFFSSSRRMCASGQFAATKGTCSRAKSHAPPTAAMVTTIWTQKRFDTLWLSKIWWISGTSSPAMWNVFRSISRAALATFRMLTPHALSRSFGLRLLLNAMNEKEAMTETEMRYSRTKRLDGCWWGCIVERASAVRVHLPPPQVSAVSQGTSHCISRARVWISPTLRPHRPLKFNLTRRCEWRAAEPGVGTVQNAMQLGRRLNHASMRAC